VRDARVNDGTTRRPCTSSEPRAARSLQRTTSRHASAPGAPPSGSSGRACGRARRSSRASTRLTLDGRHAHTRRDAGADH
jgi:hypothetical protein